MLVAVLLLEVSVELVTSNPGNQTGNLTIRLHGSQWKLPSNSGCSRWSVSKSGWCGCLCGSCCSSVSDWCCCRSAAGRCGGCGWGTCCCGATRGWSRGASGGCTSNIEWSHRLFLMAQIQHTVDNLQCRVWRRFVLFHIYFLLQKPEKWKRWNTLSSSSSALKRPDLWFSSRNCYWRRCW